MNARRLHDEIHDIGLYDDRTCLLSHDRFYVFETTSSGETAAGYLYDMLSEYKEAVVDVQDSRSYSRPLSRSGMAREVRLFSMWRGTR